MPSVWSARVRRQPPPLTPPPQRKPRDGVRRSSTAASPRRTALFPLLQCKFDTPSAVANLACESLLFNHMRTTSDLVQTCVRFSPLALISRTPSRTSYHASGLASNWVRALPVSFLLISKCLITKSDLSVHSARMTHADFTGALFMTCSAEAFHEVEHRQGRVRLPRFLEQCPARVATSRRLIRCPPV
jgi:hypothetical protein